MTIEKVHALLATHVKAAGAVEDVGAAQVGRNCSLRCMHMLANLQNQMHMRTLCVLPASRPSCNHSGGETSKLACVNFEAGMAHCDFVRRGTPRALDRVADRKRRNALHLAC